MPLPDSIKLAFASLKLPSVERLLVSDLACSPFGLGPRQTMIACSKRLKQCYILQSSYIDQIPEANAPLTRSRTEYITQERPPAIIYPSCIELEILPHELDPSLSDHRRVLAKWEQHGQRLLTRIERVADRIKPSCIVYFQGHLPEAALLRQVALQRGIPKLAVERSAFYHRLSWDNRDGIAVNSSLPQEMFQSRSAAPSRDEADSFAEAYLASINDTKQSEHASPQADFEFAPPATDGLRILLLGQVFTDSSIIFGSRPGLDPLSIIDRLSGFAAEGGHQLVIKLHPKENGGTSPIGVAYRSLTYRRISERTGWTWQNPLQAPCVAIDHMNRWNTFKLIARSDLVVTVNSQAGLEAAVMGKPVILCGRSFYSSLGFTADAQTPEELDAILQRFESSRPEPTAVQDLARQFFHFYCQQFTVSNAPGSLFRLIANRPQ